MEKDYEDLRETDVQEAIEGAIPWNPPEGPTPEGVSGTDATPEVMNDDH